MSKRVNREIVLVVLLLFFFPLVGLMLIGWAESEQRDLDNKLEGKESPISSTNFNPEEYQERVDALRLVGEMILWPSVLVCLGYLAFRVVKMVITGSWFFIR